MFPAVLAMAWWLKNPGWNVSHKRNCWEKGSLSFIFAEFEHKRWKKLSGNREIQGFFIEICHIFQYYIIKERIMCWLVTENVLDFNQWLFVWEGKNRTVQYVVTWETSLLTRINESRGVVEGVVCCVVCRINPSICFTLREEKISIYLELKWLT